MGKVLLLLITLPKTCNCFNKYELDTINFIFVFFNSCKILYKFYDAQIYLKLILNQNQIINIICCTRAFSNK